MCNKQCNLNIKDLLSRGLLKDALPLYATLAKEEPSNAEYLASQAICLCGQPDKAAEAEGLAAKASAVSGSEPRIVTKQVTVVLIHPHPSRLMFFVK